MNGIRHGYGEYSTAKKDIIYKGECKTFIINYFTKINNIFQI